MEIMHHATCDATDAGCSAFSHAWRVVCCPLTGFLSHFPAPLVSSEPSTRTSHITHHQKTLTDRSAADGVQILIGNR
jgi:hypothetical protein